MSFFNSSKVSIVFTFILVAMFLQSCSSLFYSDRLRDKNNTVKVTSNHPDYTIKYTKDGSTYVRNYNNSIYIDKLKRKYTFLTFSNSGCYDINVHVKRAPRVSAVLIDLPLSIFFLAPYAVDVFRPDFYKVSRGTKNINLQFQRTPEYFKEKIIVSKNTLNPMILDTLLLENPTLEIKKEIEEQRVVISKTILYFNIDRTINHHRNGLESYYKLVSKYPQSIPECLLILDSLKKSVEQEELMMIRKNSDLIRIIQLSKIADKSFGDSLSKIKPGIQNIVFQDISQKFDFYKIDEIIKNEDSISRTIAKEFRLNTEKKVIEEIKKNNDLSLLKRVYGNLSKPNQVILDDLRPVVTKYNDVELLKKRIHDIEYYTQFSKYDEALDLLNKSYPNEYPESLPENIILKDMLRNILIDKDISKISSIINSNDDIGQFIDEVNEILDKYKNQSLSSSQKYEIENFKKQFISKRIESVKDYVNGGGYSINEINSLLQLGKNEISTSQKTKVQAYKVIAEKNWSNEQSRRSSSNKDDEISTSDNSSNQNKSEMVLCATESGYDYVKSYKLYFYKGGVVVMEFQDGTKNTGKFTTYDGSVYVRIAGFSLVLDQGYGNNYIDKQGREWRQCWY